MGQGFGHGWRTGKGWATGQNQDRSCAADKQKGWNLFLDQGKDKGKGWTTSKGWTACEDKGIGQDKG